MPPCWLCIVGITPSHPSPQRCSRPQQPRPAAPKRSPSPKTIPSGSSRSRTPTSPNHPAFATTPFIPRGSVSARLSGRSRSPQGAGSICTSPARPAPHRHTDPDRILVRLGRYASPRRRPPLPLRPAPPHIPHPQGRFHARRSPRPLLTSGPAFPQRWPKLHRTRRTRPPTRPLSLPPVHHRTIPKTKSPLTKELIAQKAAIQLIQEPVCRHTLGSFTGHEC